MSFITKVKTAFALGAYNLWRIFVYKLSFVFGVNPVLKLSASIPTGVYFKEIKYKKNINLSSHINWNYKNHYFSFHTKANDEQTAPSWHKNFVNGKLSDATHQPWWNITDFNSQLGDIKAVWELSRLDWVLAFAQQASHGDNKSLDKLNEWLKDWIEKNPPYLGINWKCGQEASIRVIHLAIAALILEQIDSAEDTLLKLIEIHLERIAPTISYAIAQDNNHGTSEAAALYIGGSWLSSIGNHGSGNDWMKLGQKWLENRAQRLIESDGTFSQYSVNYHRLMLDTFSIVEVWRRKLDLPIFSDGLMYSLSNATNWLYQFTRLENGDVPNLGANDGARLLPLTDTDFRDFRPSVQLASALFLNSCAYTGEGFWNLQLQWLNINVPDKQLPPVHSCQFDDGGYSLLHKGNAFAVLKYPRYRFRPSQSDALHVDFWIEGVNLLRDAGTYSYNDSIETTRYFGGTKSHNTIQFDERDQMPRLSRFLFGDWLRAEGVTKITDSADGIACSAGYTDSYGASHHRKVQLSENFLKVKDQIAGFKQKAVLRWRLQPGQWKLKGHVVYNERHQLSISADIPFLRIELLEADESRYYLNKNTIPVLEIEVDQFGCLQSEYKF